AGKSTTMNMIAGYLPMSGGTVTISGTDISKEPVKAKAKIGYLPQDPPVYPDMRVKEYMSFCAGLKRIPHAKKKDEIKRVMELLRITDVKDKLIKNLSGGYKRRVGFAQAILGNPDFIILDEPTVGLDPNQVIEVRNIIKDLRKSHSVIFSSHILSEVSEVCDRVVIINKGSIRAIDTIENLEKSFGATSVLHIKVNGSKTKSASIIEMTKGVREITDITEEDNGMYSFTAQLESSNAEEVRRNLMAELIKNKVDIAEIYSEKPNLENVFIELINRPAKSGGLMELVNDIIPENASYTEDKKEEN
ncbi:MAG: ABC transporter ATP-binding protein, partial [Ruminococcus sp.]|nr:ABC transporter ATP-binding protein [Ruminococcus sp.]